MKYVYLTLSWVLGALFFLVGVLYLVEAPLAGLCLIAATPFMFPPIRNFIFSKTNRELPVNARLISIFVLFIAFVYLAGQAEYKKEKELAEQKAKEISEKFARIRQENIAYFNANREEIISSVRKAVEENNYQSAISQSNKYLVSGDSELKGINAKAKAALATMQKEERTDKLLSQLDSVPTSEYGKNRRLYQQLVELHPNNETYKDKLAFYTGKIKEEKRKEAAEEARKKKIEAQFSAWDGSHRRLEEVIKQSMNDPDSYDHVKTVYWDRGDHLVVRTTFRGKNVFGGVVKNSVKAKVSLDGQVLQILDQY